MASLFAGMTRHFAAGLNFKARAEDVGWKQVVREREEGSFDWIANNPFDWRMRRDRWTKISGLTD